MAAKTILFIEGVANSPSGDLRQGFEGLLSQRLPGKMPRIIMGNGKTQTIDKFKNNKLSDYSLALIDLDKPSEEREKDILDHGIKELAGNVFYMIQEMESWFLSQPLILDHYYGKDLQSGKKVSEKISKAEPETLADPKSELKKATKNTSKGVYNEIIHAIPLLKLLDAIQLENKFNDFKKLIEKLN